MSFQVIILCAQSQDVKWATNVDTVSKEHEKDNKESRLIRIEEVGVNENSESLTACLRSRSEVTTQNSAINEALEKVDEKLIKVMSILQRNTDNIEQLNDDLTNLKKDVKRKFDDMKQKIDDLQTLKENVMDQKEKESEENMMSLVLK